MVHVHAPQLSFLFLPGQTKQRAGTRGQWEGELRVLQTWSESQPSTQQGGLLARLPTPWGLHFPLCEMGHRALQHSYKDEMRHRPYWSLPPMGQKEELELENFR